MNESNKTGWQIEKKLPNGNLACTVVDVKTGKWVGCSNISAAFPTKTAAIAYAEEFGLTVGENVEITEHSWE